MSEEFPNRYDFATIEPRLIQKWKDEHTYQFKLSKNDKHEEIFSIDTPPPFTSGNLHMGHILNHSWIDFMARFRRLQGKKVLLPQGFDCHGLPTELKVQNDQKIDKNDREKFLQACITSTEKYIANMKKQFESLGYSTDWDHSYRTMDDSYKKLVQLSLTQFYKEGLLYRGKHPVHWCPNCETSLAKQEVGYIDVDGKIFEIKLPLHGINEFVIIATTRPEMMEACVAVFVHPNDDRYKKLDGAKVDIPFTDRTVPVIKDPTVDMAFGTGVVYCCTFGDETDIMWQQKYNLPVISVITPDGHMADISHLKGMKSKQAQKKIVEELKEKGLLVEEKKLNHRVIVHTERSSCMSPIEYLPVPQWFIKVKDFTQEIKQDGLGMRWNPDLSVRLTDWCDSLTWDWVVSRQRVFGTPIPFWYCSNMNCDYVIEPQETDLPLDPLKVKLPIEKCPKCGSKIVGEKDVCDCWIDSSISPLRVCKWRMDDEFFKVVYPTTNRPQGYEIVRTWMFYTLFRSKKLTGIRPFDEVMINGMVAGPDGRKMSKSYGNIVAPDEIMPFYGADAVRQWAALGTLGTDYPFNFHWVNAQNPSQKIGDAKIAQEKKLIVAGKLTQAEFNAKYRKDSESMVANAKFLTKIWNASRLIALPANELKITDIDISNLELTPIEAYILSEFNNTAKTMHTAWDKYVWRDGYTTFRSFFWGNFCDNYLEAGKYRFMSEDATIRATATKVALNVLLKSLIVISPILPFITEELYQRIFKVWDKKDSIHQSHWPADYDSLNSEAVKLGKAQLDSISLLRQTKSKAKIALNKDLSKAVIFVSKDVVELLKKDQVPILKTLKIGTLNVFALEDYDATKYADGLCSLQDEFTKWQCVIYS